MCGRYTLIAEASELDKEFQAIVSGPSYARYNIAPSQSAPIIRMVADGTKQLAELQWGLIPFWFKGETTGNEPFCARSEEAAKKPTFRMPFRRQRCLIPTTGYYEWKIIGGTPKKAIKQPYFIHHAAKRLFAFAGLWDRWKDSQGKIVESFSMLTRDPNHVVGALHHRMAIIVDPADYDRWLDCSLQDADQISAMLGSRLSDELTYHTVNKVVDHPETDIFARPESLN